MDELGALIRIVRGDTVKDECVFPSYNTHNKHGIGQAAYVQSWGPVQTVVSPYYRPFMISRPTSPHDDSARAEWEIVAIDGLRNFSKNVKVEVRIQFAYF